MNTEVADTGSENEIYKTKKTTILMIVIFASLSLIAGFIMNFSLEDRILGLIHDGLKKNRSCPMFYKEAKVSYFLPGIAISDLEISPRCLRAQRGLMIKDIDFSLGLPSITPMGVTFTSQISEIDGLASTINLKSIHNISTQYIRIEESTLNLASLEAIMGKLKVEGSLNMTAFMSTDLKSIKDLDAYITSKNFIIPGQVIQNFEIPTLLINNLSLKAHSENSGPIEIQELIIGSEDSPIRANATGSIELNQRNINNSKIDIEAQVKFSQDFIEQFSIINLFLGSGKPDEQGFYHMRITGTLGRPNPPVIVSP